jgi:hypothetical protein
MRGGRRGREVRSEMGLWGEGAHAKGAKGWWGEACSVGLAGALRAQGEL